MGKTSEEFKIKVKFSSLPEEEKKKLLFEVFDLALSNIRKTKSKRQRFKGRPIYFLAAPVSPFVNK